MRQRLSVCGVLALLLTCADATLAQPSATPQNPVLPALAGLWDFSAIRMEPDVAVKSVIARVRPSTEADVIARLDEKGISSADGSTLFCSWTSNSDVGDQPPRGCIYAESGYETPGVAVFAQQGDWVRIALDNSATRFGWVASDDAFHPLAELLRVGRLSYLTRHWNRRLYNAPAAPDDRAGDRAAQLSAEFRNGDSEQPSRTVGSVVIQGRLWLRVELLDGSECRPEEPRVIDTGWVPAQATDGTQWAWFWSRGC